MKNAALLLFFLSSLTVSAQQSVLNSTVTVFNSPFETGKKQYVSNAQVEDDYKKSQATTTNTEGVLYRTVYKEDFNALEQAGLDKKQLDKARRWVVE